MKDATTKTTRPAPARLELELQPDTVILEFFERRRRRAQCKLARELARDAAHYSHQHPDNRLAELALHLALEEERRREREYLDPERLGLGYTRGP